MLASTGHFMFVNILQNYTVKAVFKPITYTIVASAGPNGSISPNGNVSVVHGNGQHFTFTPHTEGFVVDQIYINNAPVGAADYYDFTNVTENQTIHVTFKRAEFVIHLSWNEGGALIPYGGANYQSTGAYSGDVHVFHNDIQMITFVPQEGYKVATVHVNGELYPNAIPTGSYTFYYITEENWLDVTFVKQTYPITAQVSNHAVITNEGTTYVAHGDDKTYDFYALPGYYIAHVFIDGIDTEISDPATINGILHYYHTFTNVVEPHTIDIVAAIKTYTVTATACEGGFITPSGTITVTHGDNKLFTFAAASGYKISEVLVDDVPNAEAVQNGAYAFLNIQEDGHTINVICEMLRFSMKSTAAANGSIYPAGITELNYGEDITYTITPDLNYKISHVLVNGEDRGELDTYTFTAVEADGEIEAFFVIDDVTGITEHLPISIYSNKNIVYITNGKHLPISNVSIFDMYGRAVWQGVPQGNEIALDVATGIYTVRVAVNDQFTTTKVNIQR
jgi:hypothetical protein